MTKSIVNTFNNLEQMISVKNNSQKISETFNSGMDKMQDFKKVFDKEINKNKTTGEGFSLGDIKGNKVKKEHATIATGIKEAFNRVEKDVKTETSLNLTLAKDIEEIISQLQEAVENTAEIIENTSKVSNNEEDKISILEILKNVDTDILKELNPEMLENIDILKELSPEILEILNKKFEELKLNNSDLEALKELINEIPNLNELISGTKIELNNSEINNEDSTTKQVLEYLNNIDPSSQKQINNMNEVKNTINTKTEIENILEFSKEIAEKATEEKSSLILDSQELTSDEIIEFSKNIADEVITSKANDLNNTNNDINSYLEGEIIEELKIESISTETDTSANDSFMQNQAPEEYALKAMINDEIEPFELKIDSASNISNLQQVQTKTSELNPSRILEQITKHLEGLQNNSKVSIVLNPESLGKVDIHLFSTKEGLMAQFTVTTQEAKDLLMKDLDSLKNSLLSQGVGVDNISVKVTDSQKSEYQEDWTEQENSENNKREQEEANKREKEKGLFEKMFSEVTENENGNV